MHDNSVDNRIDPQQWRRSPLSRIAAFYIRFFQIASRTVAPWLDLLVRLWIAQAFFVSGLLKVGNWQTALALSRLEYPVWWLDPTIAAYVGASIEIIAPVLLALGLFTRAGAFALLVLSLVIQFNYTALDTHLLWAALLGWITIRGPGPLSLDHLFVRGLADSALPGGAAMVSAAASVSRLGEPVYLLVLRIWLAATLIAASLNVGGSLETVLPLRTLLPVAGLVGSIMALLLAIGLATRMTALVMAVALLGIEMMGPGQLHATHYMVLLLVWLALRGASTYSVDELLRKAASRSFPELDGKPAFSLEGLPRVVVVGAGFGGLACVRALRDIPVSITLVDRHNYHLFQPLLYQVATTALAPGDIAVPVRTLLRDQFNVRVMLAEVTGVDTDTREVLVDSKRLPYDYLVLATGASHSYFGRDEWAPFAPGLKQVRDATAIRSRLLLAFEHAEDEDDPQEREALLTFLIVGAGPTGVELAGAIAELARYGMEKEFRDVDPASARVILVQSGPRILPAFPEKLSARATRSLQRLGVEVLTGSRVENIDTRGVYVSGKRIESRNVFWAAGVVASPAGQWLNAECDRSGRVKVADDLSVPGHDNVFVIGDTALSEAWDGRPVPGLGPAAKQAGQYAARVIRAQARGRRTPRPFRYQHLGSLATIGRKAAVADFGFVRLSGAFAWWLWGLVHVYFLSGMRNRISVMLDWAWAYITFRSSTRLITASADASLDEDGSR